MKQSGGLCVTSGSKSFGSSSAMAASSKSEEAWRGPRLQRPRVSANADLDSDHPEETC